MMSGDIVYDKIHSRHDTKWSLSLTSTEGSQLQLCVACVTEMMDSEDIAVSDTTLEVKFAVYDIFPS